MSERFDDRQRSLFLVFVWGRGRLPLRQEDISDRFKIQKHSKSSSNPDNYFPMAHTCFFSIELPKYTSIDVMTQRVSYAFLHCTSIDGDNTSTARAAARRAVNLADADDDDDAGQPSLFT